MEINLLELHECLLHVSFTGLADKFGIAIQNHKDPDSSCPQLLLDFHRTPAYLSLSRKCFTLELNISNWEIGIRKIHDPFFSITPLVEEFRRDIDIIKPEMNRLWNTYYGKPLPGMEDTNPERIAALVAQGDMITPADAYGTDEYWLVASLEGSDKIGVVDEYCPNPECPCQAAALHFYSAEPSQNSETLFEVMVDLKTRSYTIGFSNCDKDFISKTMNTLLAESHSFIPLLTRRWKELRKFMAAHMPIAVSEAEKRMPAIRRIVTGRNDPCPCGSGKKYKKCCAIN